MRRSAWAFQPHQTPLITALFPLPMISPSISLLRLNMSMKFKWKWKMSLPCGGASSTRFPRFIVVQILRQRVTKALAPLVIGTFANVTMGAHLCQTATLSLIHHRDRVHACCRPTPISGRRWHNYSIWPCYEPSRRRSWPTCRVTSGHVGRDGRGRVHAIDYSIVNHRKRRSINTPRPCGISWAALNESNQLSATRLIL